MQPTINSDELLLVARDPNIGDALCCLPAYWGLAAKYKRVLLASANRDVERIAVLPPNMTPVLDNSEPPYDTRNMDVRFVGVAAAIGYKFEEHMLHPTQCVMRYAGLDVPADVPQPKVVDTVGGPAFIYDILIAPWSRSDSRSLPAEFVMKLAMHFKQRGLHVALLGGVGDPEVIAHDRLPVGTVTKFYGQSLERVLELMRKARVAVITCDSAMNRLAHAAGIVNHVLLAANCVPHQWASHPGAHLYYQPPGKWLEQTKPWDMPSVLSLVESARRAKETITHAHAAN